MPLPNFFVIGAPKSGTSALWNSLRQHPDIFMSLVKEPRYFVFGGKPPEMKPAPAGPRRLNGIWRPDEYLRLFAASGDCRAIGEATPLYLQTPDAARRIWENIPSAKIIAVLRHPADRAYSNYLYMTQQGVETARTFHEALSQEAERVDQDWFSGTHYKTKGFYGKQLRVWYDLFPRGQIKVYLYEDWNQTPQAMLADIFRFLEVDPDFQPILKRSNVTRVPRSRLLHDLALHPNRVEKRLGRPAASLVQWLDWKYNAARPAPLDPGTRQALTEGYRDDILLLQELIGRDLSHWLTLPPPKAPRAT